MKYLFTFYYRVFMKDYKQIKTCRNNEKYVFLFLYLIILEYISIIPNRNQGKYISAFIISLEIVYTAGWLQIDSTRCIHFYWELRNQSSDIWCSRLGGNKSFILLVGLQEYWWVFKKYQVKFE